MASSSKKMKYKCTFQKEWLNKFDFISECSISVPDHRHKFRCSVCNLDLACGGGGVNDVKKHSKTPSHKEKARSVKSKFTSF